MKLGEKLGTPATRFANAGHFNEKSEFKSFLYLLNIINQKN